MNITHDPGTLGTFSTLQAAHCLLSYLVVVVVIINYPTTLAGAGRGECIKQDAGRGGVAQTSFPFHDADMALPPKVYTWLCGLFASLGSIIFGYDLGVIAGVLPATDFIRIMGPRYNDTNLVGLITSIFVLGCFFGMFPVAYMADRYGRRITIMIGAAIYVLVFHVVTSILMRL